MIVTELSYCDSTTNPTSGCAGCELWHPGMEKPLCYAQDFQFRRLSRTLPKLYSSDFSQINLIPGRMAKAAQWSDLRGTERPQKPWLNGWPRVIFLGDMSDVLSPGVPYEYLAKELIQTVVSAEGRRHIWLLLTKQSKRLVWLWQSMQAEGIAWPKNLWPGVSVTSQASTSRLADLLQVPAFRRWVSLEPILGPVELQRYLQEPGGIHWGVVGGASGRYAPSTRVETLIAETSSQFFRSRTRVYIKQLGSRVVCSEATMRYWVNELGKTNSGGWMKFECRNDGSYDVKLADAKGGDPRQWPNALRVRQMPELGDL